MTPLFFIHIPKTAGTSFRTGAVAHFGRGRIACDYGRDSPQTSDLVRRWSYGENSDPWRFRQECRSQGIAMVTGHVHAAKYAPLFGARRTLAFVRDPAMRLQSEYKHEVYNGRCSSSFRSFYRQRKMRNRQSRILEPVPLEALGFVGTTERYGDSLQLLGVEFDLEVAEHHRNLASEKGLVPVEIGAAEQEELRRLNAADFELFRRAEALLAVRGELAGAGLPFAHAAVETATPQWIDGWAWWGGGHEEPVVVEVLVNGQPSATASATELRPQLCFLDPPRAGFVGFSAAIRAHDGDTVQCRVAATGQCFPPRPHTVTEAGATSDESREAAQSNEPPTIGHVDRVDHEFCAGWAFDTRDPEHAARVQVYLNEQPVGSAVAGHPRPDVRQAGFHATGACGFWFRWPEGECPRERDHVEVRVNGDEAPLEGLDSLMP